MFVRAKTIRPAGRAYRYLHIVWNRPENGRVRQRIVGSRGRRAPRERPPRSPFARRAANPADDLENAHHGSRLGSPH